MRLYPACSTIYARTDVTLHILYSIMPLVAIMQASIHVKSWFLASATNIALPILFT